MILIIDNYDSFVHNLARYLRQLGQETLVLRNDDSRLQDVESISPQAIVISPGPMTPQQSGYSLPIARQTMGRVPLLGVCLGHQVLVESLGGQIIRGAPMHGRTCQVHHQGHPMFSNIPSPFVACRYHSLIAESTSFPKALQATAVAGDHEIMAFAHRRYPVYGVQFHPEATLTQHGYDLLANLLDLCGCRIPSRSLAELQASISCE